MAPSAGIWIRLYDPNRIPAHWTEIIREGEYCLFLLDAADRTPRDSEGRPFSSGDQSVAICRSLAEAVELANTVVARHPELCAQIYDHHGKSGDPLRVIYEPSVRGKYEGRPYAKREAFWGLLLASCGTGFIVYDARHDLKWMWGYLIGMKLFIVGGSFLVRGLVGLYEHRA